MFVILVQYYVYILLVWTFGDICNVFYYVRCAYDANSFTLGSNVAWNNNSSGKEN